MKKIAAITFGCKVNQYETSCILNDFEKHNFEIVDFSENADVYVINSCTVTNRTDFKSRNSIRKALQKKKENPNVKIIVTGCYAQRNYKEIASLGEIDFIVDNDKKGKVYEIFEKNNHNCFENILDRKTFSDLFTDKMNEKSRAFVKIQDGCDYYCTYCAIPYARGHSRSRTKESVLRQIKLLTQNGYKEFVLGGINLGLWGADLYDNYRLGNLLYDIEKIDDVKIIRLSSIEPNLFTPNLLDYFAHSQKLAPHFHIPLQSGSDRVLSLMKRRYDTKLFVKQVENIKKIFPYAALGFDLIVGFPTETNKDFLQTKSLLENLDFTYLHIFIYSKRDNTPAKNMKGFVNGSVSQKRSKILSDLSKEKTEKYKTVLINNKIPLSGIIENSKNDFKTFLSNRYIRCYVRTDMKQQAFINNLKPIKPYLDGILVE